MVKFSRIFVETFIVSVCHHFHLQLLMLLMQSRSLWPLPHSHAVLCLSFDSANEQNAKCDQL